MAAQSNSSFRQEDIFSSGLHRHAISFQSGAVNSTSEMVPIGSYYGMNSSAGNLMFCDSSSIISGGGSTTTASGNSSGSVLLDSVPGLKHDAGLAVEWTEDEQCRLEEGLVKFKDEPSIMKYVKIAAILREKTLRDVALRCRWMALAGVGLDGSNVLLSSIENMQYAVTLDVLQMVFSAYGFVQKIAMFDKNGGLQALIQYSEVQTAIAAKEALEGHRIYDGGFCKLHLVFSRHTDLSIEVNKELMGVIQSLTSKFEKKEKPDKEESCDTWEKDADEDNNVSEHKNEDTSRGSEENNVSDPMKTEN